MLLLTLDLKLGLVCLICFPVLLLLVRWFRAASASTYRTVRETAALVIVHFVETMTGIRAVQALPPRARATRTSSRTSPTSTRTPTSESFRLVAVFMPGVKLVGNLTIGVVAAVRRVAACSTAR